MALFSLVGQSKKERNTFTGKIRYLCEYVRIFKLRGFHFLSSRRMCCRRFGRK